MQARVAIRLDDSTSTDLRSRSSSLSEGRAPSSVSRRSQAGGLSMVSLTARSYAGRGRGPRLELPAVRSQSRCPVMVPFSLLVAALLFLVFAVLHTTSVGVFVAM